MKDLGKTWIEIFKESFVRGKEVSCCGLMKWETLNEMEATVEDFSSLVRKYKVNEGMETATVYLTSEMVKYIENEVNNDK